VEEEVEELQTSSHDIDALCADVIDHKDLTNRRARRSRSLGAEE